MSGKENSTFNLHPSTFPVVTLAYGDERPWGRMLERWLLEWGKFPGHEPVYVVSQGEAWVRSVCARSEWVAGVLERPIRDDRVRGNLNRSGILLAEAALALAPCLVITLDCEVLRPVAGGKDEGRRLKDEWREAKIALGVDHFQGEGAWHELGLRGFRERNCAVQWCGDAEIGQTFLLAWDRFLTDPRAWKIPCWEQVVWSWVWDYYADRSRGKGSNLGLRGKGSNLEFQPDGQNSRNDPEGTPDGQNSRNDPEGTPEAVLYPQELNWSADVAWSEEQRAKSGEDGPVIRHYHGMRKERLYQKWNIFDEG